MSFRLDKRIKLLYIFCLQLFFYFIEVFKTLILLTTITNVTFDITEHKWYHRCRDRMVLRITSVYTCQCPSLLTFSVPISVQAIVADIVISVIFCADVSTGYRR